MRILLALILLSGCASEMKVGVIDKVPIHDVSINEDNALHWCKNHLKWEKVSITYEPTRLSKLRKIVYIVEE